MKEYTVSRVVTPDWEQIPRAELTHTGWLPQCPVSATAQLCHDGNILYVRLEAVEKEIRATLTGPLDEVCEDSCLEFFFAPSSEDSRYFNIEFNPLGNFYIGFGKERSTRVRQLPGNMEQFHVKTFYTENGWGVTYEIPAEFIRMYMADFQLSGTAACNFYKCGEHTVAPHYMSWQEMTCDFPDYHRRNDFGRLIFE